MKKGIHPDYKPTTIKCACGAVYETGSTKQNITVEICSKCHPFYTGKQKLVDTSGRVDKFNKKYGIACLFQNDIKKDTARAAVSFALLIFQSSRVNFFASSKNGCPSPVR